MYSYLTSITIDNIDIKFIQQLNKRFESIINYIQSIKDNSTSTNNLINQIFIDLNQRYEIRNNYYHRTFPILLQDLCLIESNKKHFQLIEKQHYHTKQLYKRLFNIQSLTNIEQYHQQYEQSIKYLNELKNIVYQYEYDINQLKEKLILQNKQINFYSNNLFQIYFQQNQIQSNIEQLKQQILFEKQLYNQTKQHFIYNPKLTYKIDDEKNLQQQIILNNNLQNQIIQIKFNIEQQSIDLLTLQFQLYIYYKILNRNDQPSLVSTTTTKNTEEIRHQSDLLINNVNENMIHLQQPIESIRKSRKSKEKCNVLFLNIQVDNEMSVQLIENVLPLQPYEIKSKERIDSLFRPLIHQE
jgi:hypothetical protein